MKTKIAFVGLIFCVLFYYLFPSRLTYDCRLPVAFLTSGLPVTEVRIGESGYSLMLDLGSSCFISLRKSIITEIDKTKINTTTMTDFKGEQYDINKYLVPEIKVGKMKVAHVPVNEDSDAFLDYGAIIDPEAPHAPTSEKLGRIGRGIFVQGVNLFLDFSHSVMFVNDHAWKRRKNGYRIEKMVRVPFALQASSGIVVKIRTEEGFKRFILDTGATSSFVKPSVVSEPAGTFYRFEHMMFGRKDFGPLTMRVLDISPAFGEIDGILGMDFIKEHVLYLDFLSNELLIGRSQEVAPHERT